MEPRRFTVPLTSSLARPRSAALEGRQLGQRGRRVVEPGAAGAQAAQRRERRRPRRAHAAGARRAVGGGGHGASRPRPAPRRNSPAVMRLRPSCCSSSTSSQPSPAAITSRSGPVAGTGPSPGKARQILVRRAGEVGDRADVRRERAHLVGDRPGRPAPVDLLVGATDLGGIRGSPLLRAPGHGAGGDAVERRATPSTAAGARSSYAAPASRVARHAHQAFVAHRALVDSGRHAQRADAELGLPRHQRPLHRSRPAPARYRATGAPPRSRRRRGRAARRSGRTRRRRARPGRGRRERTSAAVGQPLGLQHRRCRAPRPAA